MKVQRKFEPAVFFVNNPKCKRCAADLEFRLFENFEQTGLDWIPWYCSRGCGFHFAIEIT